MARRYYTVLIREGDDQPWGIHFGDFDREVATQEREDISGFGNPYKKKNTKIITTGAAQSDIDAAVTKLNQKG